MERLALYFLDLDVQIELDPRRRMVFGASETCDVDLRRYLPAQGIRTVSRRHFEISFVRGEGYIITDLHSLNGTRVNGCLLPPGEPRFLRDGDTVMLAENPHFLMRVCCDHSEQTELIFPPAKNETLRAVEQSSGQLYLAADGRFVPDGVPVPRHHLTALEEKLLLYLYERSGRVCSYDEVIRDVWGYARYDDVQDSTVAKTVSNLRKKLDDISPGAGQRHLRTVRGRGLMCAPV